MNETVKLSRREFVVGTAALSGGLLLGFHIPFARRLLAAEAHAHPDVSAEVNAWIVIRPDETVVIRVARSEMGQGIFTALPMLVAEELQCDWARVQPEYASAHEHVTHNQIYVNMSTGGSRSVRESQDYLRKAGATAREMLVTAAANGWGVPASECDAANGVITHSPSGRSTTFGAVAAAAAKLEPPKEVKIKAPSEWKLIGKPVKRLDTANKVNGSPVFGADMRVPEMLHAAIRACPVFGGKLKSYDESAIRGRPGVRRVVPLPDAVAVVADSWWRAHQALNALPVTWDEGPNAKVGSDTILASLREGLEAQEAAVGRADGDVEGAFKQATKQVMAEYYAPYLNHATMEPMNCTARVTPDRVDIWVPTQNAEASLMAAAEAAEVDPGQVYVHNTMLGGGFGRRGAFQDYTRQAVRVAKAVGKPVKLMWSREEDMQHGFYRPIALARLTAGLDDRGMPVAWIHYQTLFVYPIIVHK